MTQFIYIHQKEQAQSFTRLPNFLFESPFYQKISNEAKILYAYILRRTDLSRKNGWADEYDRIYPKMYGKSSEVQLLDVSPTDIELVLSEEL